MRQYIENYILMQYWLITVTVFIRNLDSKQFLDIRVAVIA